MVINQMVKSAENHGATFMTSQAPVYSQQAERAIPEQQGTSVKLLFLTFANTVYSTRFYFINTIVIHQFTTLL